jgi:methyl-accepting chemotaxis protein
MIVIVVVAGLLLHRIVFLQLGAEPVVSRKLTQILMNGDFSSTIKLQPNDSNSLLYFLSGMRSRWIDVLTSLRSQALSMAKQSDELSADANMLANNCSSQSQSTAVILANVEQLSVSVDNITNDADVANRQVKRTGEVAQEAAGVLNGVVEEIQAVSASVSRSSEQMGLLDARTNDIVGIVAVIKGIADQTNLLALNAAIEAARAGELGRGFAVVADEVRTLAQRVAESTHTITAMVSDVHSATRQIVESIEDCVDRAKTSVNMSQIANESMEKISRESISAAQQVSRINTALIEQRNSTRDIVNNMIKISQVTDQNFATSDKVSKASLHLDKIAHSITQEISYFKFDSNGAR